MAVKEQSFMKQKEVQQLVNYLSKDYEKDCTLSNLSGIEFLRVAVRYFDNRNETLNENKSPLQLLADFKNMIDTFDQ